MRLVLSLLLAVAWCGAASAQSITLLRPDSTLSQQARQVPVRNTPIRMTLPEPANLVRVVWRPNSAIPDTVTVFERGGRSFLWTPSRAGVATIITDTGLSQNVSVRYDTFPASGLLILILAGGVLFGGAGFALGKLLGAEMPDAHPERRPDT